MIQSETLFTLGFTRPPSSPNNLSFSPPYLTKGNFSKTPLSD